jgi:hypothetical protein
MSWAGMNKQPPSIVKLDQEKYALLKELSEDSDYWASALKFVDSVKNRDFYSLTDKQADWLTSIMAELSVRVDRRTAREIFNEDKI